MTLSKTVPLPRPPPSVTRRNCFRRRETREGEVSERLVTHGCSRSRGLGHWKRRVLDVKVGAVVLAVSAAGAAAAAASVLVGPAQRPRGARVLPLVSTQARGNRYVCRGKKKKIKTSQLSSVSLSLGRGGPPTARPQPSLRESDARAQPRPRAQADAPAATTATSPGCGEGPLGPVARRRRTILARRHPDPPPWPFARRRLLGRRKEMRPSPTVPSRP